MQDSVTLPTGHVFAQYSQELRGPDGGLIPLRPQIRAVLACLAERSGAAVSKQALMASVWPGLLVTDDSLVQCIAELRRILGDHERTVIRTEIKRGYRLMLNLATDSNGPVRRIATAEAAAQPLNGFDPSVARSLAGEFRQSIRYARGPDGVSLAYAVSGAGMPVVRTLHWLTHLDWDWRSPLMGPYITHYSSKYMYLRYDGRGFGLSDRSIPTGIDTCIDDLEAVVDAAGMARFALVGTSGGGAISMAYAARHPERVSHLVLVGAFSRGVIWRGDPVTARKTYESMIHLIRQGWGSDNPAARQLLTSTMFPDADTEEARDFNQMQRVSCPPEDAAALYSLVSRVNIDDRLASIRTPTLVVHCTGDAMIPFENGRFLADSIAGARLLPVESRNHVPLPMEPAYRELMDAIDRFLHTG
jgi:pimeloyl-ACP methyl ester carboxylesterase/DNA-binding winged helix-turn-helix (wHTH) protein